MPALVAAQSSAGAPGTEAERAAAPGDEAQPNKDPEFLQVYDANVENLPTTDESNPENPGECESDWRDLLYYMRTQELKPDVYLVQQLNDRDQSDLLLERMESPYGEKYEGALAENDPKPTGGDKCNDFKKRQTNAVIWRTERLDQVKSKSPYNMWQAQADTGPGCANNGGISRTRGGQGAAAGSRIRPHGHRCLVPLAHDDDRREVRQVERR